MLTVAPSRILKRPVKRIAVGQEANLAITDLKEEWTYDVHQSPSKSRNSPFHGRKLKGKVVLTLYRGAIVFRDELRLSKALAREKSRR
jgi:dihydroorotase